MILLIHPPPNGLRIDKQFHIIFYDSHYNLSLLWFRGLGWTMSVKNGCLCAASIEKWKIKLSIYCFMKIMQTIYFSYFYWHVHEYNNSNNKRQGCIFVITGVTMALWYSQWRHTCRQHRKYNLTISIDRSMNIATLIYRINVRVAALWSPCYRGLLVYPMRSKFSPKPPGLRIRLFWYVE